VFTREENALQHTFEM
jgi:hypothetical protein